MGNSCRCNKMKSISEISIKNLTKVPSKATESFLNEKELDLVQ